MSLRVLADNHHPLLTTDALAFVESLVRAFGPRIEERLAARKERQRKLDEGAELDFLAETAKIRSEDWRVSPAPADLQDRRVEITGPTDRKMIINALNSGASVFMADLEDATCPTWKNLLDGQQNLFDAVRRTITLDDKGKHYALAERTATLLVRPRGLHLPEKNVLCDDAPIPGCLFDFGLYFFHNARALVERGTGPYFYLPKLESHLEAAVWSEVFTAAETHLQLPKGTIRATVLIETLPAAFQMDEILYQLRDHIVGLNCGRWDYIFSYIKTFRARADKVLPNRSVVTMEQPNMAAYADLLVKTCHRRGAHAMGGMAAQIPIKNDPVANDAALAKVRADKTREVKNGHDGTWVAHPGLVPIAKEIFDREMPGPNQLERKREDVNVTAADLVVPATGARTDAGLRHNIRVGIRYVEAWLRGLGCVPLDNLMEDAATAEISRSQVWQWLRHGAPFDDGTLLTRTRLTSTIDEEMARIETEIGAEAYGAGRFTEARALFEQLASADELQDFLTVPAYALV